jgi:hypothetical protein
MDKFRTRVDIPPSAEKIGYQTKCLLMGSCFSDSIGKIMADHKFPVILNPFGTLFNPFSLGQNINHLVSSTEFTPAHLHNHNGLWFSMSHYTGFSHPDRDTCLSAINRSLTEASRWLKQCDYLLLTLGTARIFRWNDTGEIVANCHKLPAASFTSRLAAPDEIIRHFDPVFNGLRQYNPKIRVIFTLSPVRHWSDGAETNQLSKSILHFSIHELLKRHPGTYYFPAYEIFMDELRDYRFYAADMLHPSEPGTWYVWERFSDSWLDETSKKIMADVAAILRAARHRPLHTESTNHKKFRQTTLQQIERLAGLYPFLDFSNEIALLQL